MIGVIIALSIFCIVLLLLLGKQDDKNTALAAENGLLKGRMENMREAATVTKVSTVTQEYPLTISDILEAIRYAGYVPDNAEHNNLVKVMVAGEPFFIDAGRLPLVMVERYYNVKTEEWDVTILKQAAHLMADEYVMVKALINEDKDGTSIRFVVAAMDRDSYSFKENLMTYINLINDGNRRVKELYEKIEEEKTHPALTSSALIQEAQQDNKILS